MKQLAVKLFSFITGWTFDHIPKDIGDKFILIGFPHTSNFDAPLTIAMSFFNDIKIRPLVKREVMFFPLSCLFKGLGSIVVNRNKNQGLVANVAAEFSKFERCVIGIAPEGTRKQVQKIKLGFWHIANAANVPIVLTMKDSLQKKIRYLGKLSPSDEFALDWEKIKTIYRQAGFADIDNFATA